MSIFIIKALQFILSLSIIVAIHELGHFLGARVCKTRVDKFYLFFNPWFSIFKRKYKETEYGIGWIPLGGFVKIAGMVDESMDKKQMALPAQSWEYRSKKPWQKLIMMTGGVIFNFVLAWGIYFLIFLTNGEEYVDASALPHGIAVDSLGRSIGLQDGDIIFALDDKEVTDFGHLPAQISLEPLHKIIVKRNGALVDINVPENFGVQVINKKKLNFISIRFLNQALDSVNPAGLAKRMGLQKGDLILSVNRTPIQYRHELTQTLNSFRNQMIMLTVQRDNRSFETDSFLLGEDGKLDVLTKQPLEELKNLYKKRTYTFWESIPAAFNKNINVLASYWSQLKVMVSGKVNLNENMGGLVTMGKLFPEEWSWISFWKLTAFLSLVIGLINILPIPALDGGHVTIIIIEWITGKTIPIKVLEIVQTVGIVLLVGLMLYAQGLDILRLLR